MGLVANIKKMYRNRDGHVHVLAAVLLEHLLYSFALGAELATLPAKLLEQMDAASFPFSTGIVGTGACHPVESQNRRASQPWDVRNAQSGSGT
jgi:transaldolase